MHQIKDLPLNSHDLKLSTRKTFLLKKKNQQLETCLLKFQLETLQLFKPNRNTEQTPFLQWVFSSAEKGVDANATRMCDCVSFGFYYNDA